MAQGHDKLTTSGLQDRLQHHFHQPQLLELALTHRSFSS
ncbi:MAG: ribonuclease III, partial [Betaproteobacteria bacterium]|nr:ribonuclease III [Betaproteobacteria bacterium]